MRIATGYSEGMNTETLTGYTTQAHTFGITGRDKVRRSFQTVPAGTLVYVRRIRANGTCEARIPGTRLTQTVYLSTIRPA